MVQEQVRDSVIRQYQGESLSAVGQVFVSDEPELVPRPALDDDVLQRAAVPAVLLVLRARPRPSASAGTPPRAASTTSPRSSSSSPTRRPIVDDKLAEAKDLLAELEAEERERLEAQQVSRSAAEPAPVDVSVSGNAGAAVPTRWRQVGDAYVYGAAGPDAFDCSGLTMMAWAQAGVSLPHSSSAQYGSGPHVAASALQPGDLVFYYSPISHVGMYIGNGHDRARGQPEHRRPGRRVSTRCRTSGAVRPG